MRLTSLSVGRQQNHKVRKFQQETQVWDYVTIRAKFWGFGLRRSIRHKVSQIVAARPANQILESLSKKDHSERVHVRCEISPSGLVPTGRNGLKVHTACMMYCRVTAVSACECLSSFGGTLSQNIRPHIWHHGIPLAPDSVVSVCTCMSSAAEFEGIS